MPAPLPAWPAALSEELAAAYVSLSVTTFKQEVDAGRAPQPIWLTRRRKAWRRRDLENWLDRLAADEVASEVANEWG